MARYQLIRKLATGGMAEVFLGRAIGSGGFQKPVAIKRILPHLGADREFVTRFHDEARLTVHLQHANVVQVFDLGQTARDHVMVLEFVDGVTLRELFREARLKNVELPLREMIFVVQQVAEGLAYAHEVTGPDRKSLNIIHRDINPSNVLVSSAGEVKLADFGIARAALAQSSTAAGVVRGKVGYFSPEVAKGSDGDQRSDVFLMGVMLYESVTQRRLFKENDFVKSLVEVGQFDLSTVQCPPNVPAPLWDIVLSGLNPDPDQRVPSSRELSLKLSSYLFENRMRVGPSDVAQLFSKVYPERRSALHDLEASPVVAEVNLAAEASASSVRVLPAPAPSAPAVAKDHENDFVPPMPVPPRPGSGLRAAHVPAPSASRPGVRPKLRLGELLVAHKLITAEQLEHGLKMQKRMGQQLGDVLVSLNVISEDDLYSTLAEQKGHRFVRTSKLDAFEISDALRALVPRELGERLRVVPLSLDEKRQLFIAMVNPGDLAVLDEVRSRADVPRVIGVMIRPKTLDRLIDRVYLNKAVDLELPEWASDQGKLIERFGSKTSDSFTKSRERIFGEEDLGESPTEAAAERPRTESNSAGQIASMLDLVAGAAAAREDAMGQQLLRLTHVVRALCGRLGVEGPALAAVERQAVALFMAGQLEDRRFYEPPCAVTVKQLLAGFPPRDDAFVVYTAEQRATSKPTTAAQQVLGAVFSLGFKLGDLDAPAEKVAAALVEVQGQGWVPASVVGSLSQLMQQLPPAVAIIAAPGSVLFAVAPALTRLGHRVVASRTDCLERARASRAIIDATLSSPQALELVHRATKLGARVAAVAPPQVLHLIQPWKSNAVTVLSTDDLRGVVAWVRQT